MASNSKAKAAARAERAAALRREQEAQERRRNLIRGLVAAGVLVALVVVVVFISRANDVEAPTTSDYGVAVGDAEAPHTLIIYEDFLCPGCGQLEEQSNDELQELADDGKVYVEYRPIEILGRFGDYSARAASAFGVVLEESGPEVAKEFHDLLFEEQPEEDAESFPDDEWLIEKAVEAGAAEEEVRPGIEEGVNDFVEKANAEAEQAGVSGTPTVVLDGETFNGTVEELLDAVD